MEAGDGGSHIRDSGNCSGLVLSRVHYPLHAHSTHHFGNREPRGRARLAEGQRHLFASSADHAHGLRHRPALKNVMGTTVTSSQTKASTGTAIFFILAI